MSLILLSAKIVDLWAVAILFGGAGFVLASRRRSRAAIDVLRAASLLAAVSGAVWFATLFVSVTEDTAGPLDADAWTAFLSAPFAMPWIVRLGLCGLALALTAARTPVFFLFVGILFAVDQAWLGHAVDAHGAGVLTSLVFYILHVLGGFAWVGALTMLCVTAWDDVKALDSALALFSSVGIGLVALIAATGLVNAALRGVDIRHIDATDYSRLLAAKLVMFAAMLMLALYNRKRRQSRVAAPGSLMMPIIAETILGLVVVALAATLGLTAPS